jgi:hypothetical protein
MRPSEVTQTGWTMRRALSWILGVLFLGWMVTCVGLGFLGLYEWLFLFVAPFFIVLLGYIGLELLFHPHSRAFRSWNPFFTNEDSYPTFRERLLYSSLSLGGSLILLVFVILDLLGIIKPTLDENASYIIIESVNACFLIVQLRTFKSALS